MRCGRPLPKRTTATAGAINARFHWTGHLFQGCFGAVVMDEPHLLAAARYIMLNPVVAGLVSRAGDWPWSNAREASKIRPLHQADRVPRYSSRFSQIFHWRHLI
jgi:hypothetical protein